MYLHELFGPDAFIEDFYESLNTRIPVEDWKTLPDESREGILHVDDDTYILVLEPKTYPFDGITYSFINVVFRKLVNGTPSEDLTFTNRAGSKVLGAIAYGLHDELKHFEADAIIFIAVDHIEKHMSIYSKITRRFKGFTSLLKNVKIPGGEMTILFNNRLPISVHKKFVEFVKQQEVHK